MVLISDISIATLHGEGAGKRRAFRRPHAVARVGPWRCRHVDRLKEVGRRLYRSDYSIVRAVHADFAWPQTRGYSLLYFSSFSYKWSALCFKLQDYRESKGCA